MTVYEGKTKTTSPYGMRIHPTKKVQQMHYGSDEVGQASKRQRLVLPEGTVEAVNIGYCSGRGNNVVICQNTTRGIVRARYQHNSEILVTVGQRLVAGNIVGVEGSTGDSTGSHTHIEITVNGVAVDPSPWLGHPNATGTYEQNDLVYDYGTDKTYTLEENNEMYIKLCAPVEIENRSSLLKDGWVFRMTTGGKIVGYNPAEARMAKQLAADYSNLSPAYEELRDNMQPGEILLVVE